MVDFIYSILSGLGQDGIIEVVLRALFALAALGLVSAKFRRAVPGLMTSLGILGTFCGIFIALYPLDFSAEQINASIEELLNGMKTAFATSLLGIAAAIVFRAVVVPVWEKILDLVRRVGPPPPPLPEQQAILIRLDAIKGAIAGDGDSSLVTQMQKMRDENRDGFKKLDGKLEGLADAIRGALVENLEKLIQDIRDIIGKQLGDSLQQLIRNIEKALIEQFGQTFIKFNEATLALNQWQQEHRSQVEQMTNAFNQAALQITHIAEKCEAIPKTMESLQEMIKGANADIEELNKRLQAFAELRRQATEAFPLIKSNLDKIGEDLQSSAKGFENLGGEIREIFRNAEEQSRQAAEQYKTNMNEMSAAMLKNVQDVQGSVSDAVTDLSGKIQEVFGNIEEQSQEAVQAMNAMSETMRAKMDETTTALSNRLEAMQIDISDNVEKIVQEGVTRLSEQVEAEMNRVATAWGEKMVSIAEALEETTNRVRNSGRGRQ